MSFIYKEKFENRANGLEKVIGHPVDIRWGPEPKTDGRFIYLPDEKKGIWDSDSMVRCGFAHEISHIMFESDIQSMYDWIDSWSNDGSKVNFHDPYGIVEQVANTVIQVTEDQRIESLYGELYPGAKSRFKNEEHRAIQQIDSNEVDKDPATAYLLMRTSKWQDFGSDWMLYSDIKDQWGEDMADVFWEALDDVEGASHDMTYLAASRVMQEILPWYEEMIRFAMDDKVEDIQDDLQDIEDDIDDYEEEVEQLEQDLEDLRQERREEEAEGNFDEADELDDQIEKLKEEKEEIEDELDDLERDRDRTQSKLDREIERHQEQNEELEELKDDHESKEIQDDIDQDDYEPPEETLGPGDVDYDDEDVEELQEEMDDKIDEIQKKMSGESFSPPSAEEGVSSEIVHKSSAGVKKAQIYHGIVDEIVSELRRIDGRKRTQLASSGESIDVNELIRSETVNPGNTELMNREISELGFSCMVLLDLSMSMMGSKLNVCRNVGSTLHKAFERLEEVGFPVDFTVVGFGGHHMSNKTMIKECETVDETEKITHDPDFARTPIWHAVDYARRQLRTEEGAQTMILITDGTPTGLHDGGDAVDGGRALSYTRQHVQRARDEGISMFTLGIGVNLEPEEMRQTYGHYRNVDDEQQAGRVLLDFVHEEVREHMMLR